MSLALYNQRFPTNLNLTKLSVDNRSLFRRPHRLGHLRVVSRQSTEELLEAAVTVGLVVLLFERAFVQLLQTECADKVLGMELSEHCRDTTSCKQTSLEVVLIWQSGLTSPGHVSREVLLHTLETIQQISDIAPSVDLYTFIFGKPSFRGMWIQNFHIRIYNNRLLKFYS